MDRLPNVATPLTATTLSVPESVPPPGFVPIATVTSALPPTKLPLASWSRTVTGGEIEEPAAELDGGVPNARFVASPGLMLKDELVPPVSPGLAAVNVYPVPVLSTERLLNVATPLTAATVKVPEDYWQDLSRALPSQTVSGNQVAAGVWITP
jgi:hypothetical protein